MAKNYFGITDTGRVRDNNEDAFIAEKVLGDRYIMACAIDGVGGYEGGEVAARIAREVILHYFNTPSGEVITMMQEALGAANEKIAQEKLQNRKVDSMACVVTLAVVDVENNKFYYAHVGDTRLYLLRDGSLVKITKDHSFVGFLEDSGRLTEEEAMRHPKRNEINKALGFDGQLARTSDYIETGESPFLPGDMLLLCSDGLTDMLSKSEITSVLVSKTSLVEKGKALVNAANAKGGKDNITAVLVQHPAKPMKQTATKPAVAVKKNDRPHREAAPARPEQAQPERRIKRSGSKNVIVALSLFSFLLLTALVYLLVRNGEKENKAGKIGEPLIKNLNSQEQKLEDALFSLSGHTLVLSDSLFGNPLLLTDTVQINMDSLHLQGRGSFVFTKDSAYKGPAVAVGPNCRYLLLENMTFQNFDIGILVQNKMVHLKNVQFRNCRVPVQYQIHFRDSTPISGIVGDSILFKNDSLSKSF